MIPLHRELIHYFLQCMHQSSLLQICGHTFWETMSPPLITRYNLSFKWFESPWEGSPFDASSHFYSSRALVAVCKEMYVNSKWKTPLTGTQLYPCRFFSSLLLYLTKCEEAPSGHTIFWEESGRTAYSWKCLGEEGIDQDLSICAADLRRICSSHLLFLPALPRSLLPRVGPPVRKPSSTPDN